MSRHQTERHGAALAYVGQEVSNPLQQKENQVDIGYTDSDFSDTPSRPKVVSPATVLPPVSSSQERSQNAPLAGELERLREILYGGQARVTERRLSDQEKQIETLRRELTDMLNEKVDNFVSTSEVELSSTRSELSERLEQQANQQTGALRTAQHTLSERLDKQELDQVTELRTIQKDVNERLEKLGTDFVTHLRNIQRELSERITQINNEQTERLRQLQNDSRQRNSNLRQELLMLAASLEDNKISRHELGHMLQELGQRLRTDRYGAR